MFISPSVTEPEAEQMLNHEEVHVSQKHWLDLLLAEEAIRVTNRLPDFIPGSQGGKPVSVWYMIPITFTLK